MNELDQFYGPNAGYALELMERRQSGLERAGQEPLTPAIALDGRSTAVAFPQSADIRVAAAASVGEFAERVRFFGHLAAHLDPLGSAPPGDLQLEPASYGLTENDLLQLPPAVVSGPAAVGARNALDALSRLRGIYCASTGYEFAHVQRPGERSWLLEAIEDRRFWPPVDPVDERWLLDRLTELSAFERFLQRAYPGQTRFSIEGLGMLIPMLDELIDCSARTGTRTITLGMAHRGRLNVLAHVLGKPYARVLAEFEGRAASQLAGAGQVTFEGWMGDVKYHAGGTRDYPLDDEAHRTVVVQMVPNPSHLEYVNPVVEGMARGAHEDRRRRGPPVAEERASLAVLIHGDAAFPGQGVVAETLNLSGLQGYATGGTIHVIANNQLGFTTGAREGRSTLYASDLAKGFEIPIVHVNADDPIACLASVRLAVGYRQRFARDVLIDLVGYRRWGHNEGDEASFTQPLMYAAIAAHPTVREQYSADLVRRGVVAPAEPAALLRAGMDEFQRIRDSIRPPKESTAASRRAIAEKAEDGRAKTIEPVPLHVLVTLNAELLQFPGGFAINPKLDRALQRRRAAFESATGAIDWGHAETLAFASLLRDGIPVRLSGQDARRGTFSQRHLTYYDVHSGADFTPLQALPSAVASFEVHNSPLSESAVLGFEYGYTLTAPEALVLWEAQYGDFVNSAQVIADEFLIAAQAKWDLRSGLVVLLPHAWEGQGPDHSSGRLERFLELAAEDNVRIVNCSTAGQYYHLLRRQAASLGVDPRPLIVLTPKSLLRQALAGCTPADLADAQGFRPLIDDPATSPTPKNVRRVIFCSGKIWAEVVTQTANEQVRHTVAVVRIEELYPFPAAEVTATLKKYEKAAEIVWLQEEPRNMGAWGYMERQLRDLVLSGGKRTVTYVGRPDRASPAEGWADVHAAEQHRVIQQAVCQGVAHVQ